MGQALDSNHTKGLHLDRKLSGNLVSGLSCVGGKSEEKAIWSALLREINEDEPARGGSDPN